MLVAGGLVTREQLDAALKAQQETGLRLGQQLVKHGHVSEVQLTQVLSNQLSLPWVSVERIEFSASLLGRIPAELADRYTVIPIYVRSVRGQGDTLYVAMDDPTDAEALRKVSEAAAMPVKPMVAPPSDIRRAIDQRYFGADSVWPASAATAPALSVPGSSSDDVPGPPPAIPSAKRAPVPKPPPVGKGPTPSGVVDVETYNRPSQPPPAAPARTLTLLDGTTLSLPAPGASQAVQDVRHVRDVIRAIVAADRERGDDRSPRWEDVVDMLIDLARDRGVLLTRKDVADAWLRRKG